MHHKSSTPPHLATLSRAPPTLRAKGRSLRFLGERNIQFSCPLTVSRYAFSAMSFSTIESVLYGSSPAS
eukprot:1883714-Lingulodinium_polyedra.AAC.1